MLRPKAIAWLDETHHKTALENLMHHWCNEILKRYDFMPGKVCDFFDKFKPEMNAAVYHDDWYTLKKYCEYIDKIKERN